MEILSINWAVESVAGNIICAVLIAIVVALIFSLGVTAIIDPDKFVVVYSITFAILFACAGFFLVRTSIKECSKLEVTAIIKDDVSFNELYGKYTEIEKDGRVYKITYEVDRDTFDIDKAREEAGCND